MNTIFTGKIVIDFANEPSIIFDKVEALSEQQKEYGYAENILNLSRNDTIVFKDTIKRPEPNTIKDCSIEYVSTGGLDGMDDFEDYFLITEIANAKNY